MTTLLAAPLASFFTAGAPIVSALLLCSGVVLVAAVSVCDLVALGCVLRARRRMMRGLPPPRHGIDYGVGPDVWCRTAPADSPYRAQDRIELLARGSPAAAARMLTRNLALLGCGALSLIAVIVAVSLCIDRGECRRRPEGVTRAALGSIRSAALLHLVTHNPHDECPSVATLQKEGLLERAFPPEDPWGREWVLECDGDEITASSDGPDRRPCTEDDIVMPPLAAEPK